LRHRFQLVAYVWIAGPAQLHPAWSGVHLTGTRSSAEFLNLRAALISAEWSLAAQNGGSARNYPAGLALRAPGYGPSARAAQPYFYAASGVVVDIRYCRVGRGLFARGWWESLPDQAQARFAGLTCSGELTCGTRAFDQAAPPLVPAVLAGDLTPAGQRAITSPVG
jgi:hypothetical protein